MTTTYTPTFPFEVPQAPEGQASVDPIEIIRKYYDPDSQAFQILVEHSAQVAQEVLRLAQAQPDKAWDLRFLFEAAMLHDIGVFLCEAPYIDCHGTEPYIRHGYLGGTILRGLGLDKHALVAERHTGTGLDRDEIIAQNVSLPLNRTYMPLSLPEKLICYADNFYSKTHLGEKKSADAIIHSLEKYGTPSVARFRAMQQLFEPQTNGSEESIG